jgi:hypothetical protein
MMDSHPFLSSTQSLYPRLVGKRWAELPEQVRAAHNPSARLRGTFRVRRGRGLGAGFLCRLFRLPPPGRQVPVILDIAAGEAREVWVRRVGNTCFATLQWSEGGALIERSGPIELQFHLRASGGVLRYRQVGCRLRIGPLRVPVPSWVAPRVAARESAGRGDGETRVWVRIRLPGGRLLLSYGGRLQREG